MTAADGPLLAITDRVAADSAADSGAASPAPRRRRGAGGNTTSTRTPKPASVARAHWATASRVR
ncbi:MAG: hypothetical protein DYG90_04830, partial [Chloroflexi bacterium CFX6]|nr:hypothetical protein [Chloroflexi bacterium CFX6]